MRFLLVCALLLALGHRLEAGVLYSSRFESPPATLETTAEPGVEATARWLEEGGTIDRYRGARSHALSLQADFSRVEASAATAGFRLPAVEVTNPEADLARLTLSFDVWVSERIPVLVRMESLDCASAHARSDRTLGLSARRGGVSPDERRPRRLHASARRL
jgi:hypothetical protein